jgi:uncharacterized protein involved in propanediol utilization
VLVITFNSARSVLAVEMLSCRELFLIFHIYSYLWMKTSVILEAFLSHQLLAILSLSPIKLLQRSRISRAKVVHVSTADFEELKR